ncbi:NUDIX domain-containing protein [Actinokineospora cianjurensis]|uniref:NUDIX hydrolase n=1 Tax=Actinokineospora cianjurensis TaxID=585224 RepID=UPI001476A245
MPWHESTTSTSPTPSRQQRRPPVTVVIRNDAGHLPLIHRANNNLWALPGGGHDPGERITETVVHEPVTRPASTSTSYA